MRNYYPSRFRCRLFIEFSIIQRNNDISVVQVLSSYDASMAWSRSKYLSIFNKSITCLQRTSSTFMTNIAVWGNCFFITILSSILYKGCPSLPILQVLNIVLAGFSIGGTWGHGQWRSRGRRKQELEDPEIVFPMIVTFVLQSKSGGNLVSTFTFFFNFYPIKNVLVI